MFGIKSIQLIDKIPKLRLKANKIIINSLTQIMENNNNSIHDEKHVKEEGIKVDDNKPQLDDISGHQTKRLKTEDNINKSSQIENVIECNDKPKERLKLRKWVLLLSYCGNNYYGMQRQSWDATLPTIESQLLLSLWKSDAITEEKYKSPHLARFQRAARTDKGVSAIRQIVSILLPIDFCELIPKVNQYLPPEIRLISGKRVTKFFDAKNFCDGRTYSYLMPSYSLCPFDESTTQSFRLNQQILDEFNQLLRLYIGTHNYHNFTAHKKATDASASRYIMQMDCSQPFIKDDIELVVVRVKGQSFMLHQIRKMIGLAIAIMRGLTNKETIIKAFDALRLDIPMAPGLGLLLEEVHYDRYNTKYGGDGIHEAIEWNTNNAEIDEFKHKYIYPVIIETEKKEMAMFKWLQTLILHTYDVREPAPNVLLNKEDVDQSSEAKEDKSKLRSPIFMAHLNAKNAAKDSVDLDITHREEKDVESNAL